MSLFSRNKEAIEAVHVDDVPFESLKRSPRNTRKPRVDTDFDSAGPIDPADTDKKRARHRLVGAIALGLAAIVFVPMLFDRTPVAPADDINLQIPERDAPFEGRRGVPDPARGPLRPSTDAPTVVGVPPSTPSSVGEAPSPAVPDAAPAIGEPEVPTTVAKAPEPVKPATKAEAAPKAIEKPAAAKVAEKSAEKSAEKPAEKPKAATDDPRALAALEGKPESASSDSGGNKTYAVQIAAFSAADKAKGLRDQLVSNGLKAYVESVSTAQGLRTRVRLGPFATRDAADRAKQKLKTMKLDGSVVPL